MLSVTPKKSRASSEEFKKSNLHILLSTALCNVSDMYLTYSCSCFNNIKYQLYIKKLSGDSQYGSLLIV